MSNHRGWQESARVHSPHRERVCSSQIDTRALPKVKIRCKVAALRQLCKVDCRSHFTFPFPVPDAHSHQITAASSHQDQVLFIGAESLARRSDNLDPRHRKLNKTHGSHMTKLTFITTHSNMFYLRRPVNIKLIYYTPIYQSASQTSN